MKLQDRREYTRIVSITNTLYQEYKNENLEWVDSPFNWIRNRPSRTIGAIGEKIVSMWLAAYNFNINRCPDSDADRIIEEKRVEIKFSTLWKSGVYKFQQLRNQNYDFAILLGISPHFAHCWVIEKREIMQQWKNGNIHSQHGGSKGSDTAWLNVIPENPQDYLIPQTGSLSEALITIAQLTNYALPSLTDEFDGV